MMSFILRTYVFSETDVEQIVFVAIFICDTLRYEAAVTRYNAKTEKYVQRVRVYNNNTYVCKFIQKEKK